MGSNFFLVGPGRPERQERMKHVCLGPWPPKECQAAPKDPKAAVSLQYRPAARGQIRSGTEGSTRPGVWVPDTLAHVSQRA